MATRKIDPDILKKLHDEWMKMNQLQSSAISTGRWNTSHGNPSGNISPTDIGAKGRFEYQEPEVDEQGTYYGYKVLHRNVQGIQGCGCVECSALRSPRYPAKWLNGELQSDREPSEHHMSGIHFTKRPDHPELRNYYGMFHGAAYSPSWYENSKAPSVLVKCALSGTIVETEQGFRAQHAQIIGVLFDGHWQSYQDYQERTQAHSRPITYEKRQWERKLYGGSWDTDSNYVTNPFTNPDI